MKQIVYVACMHVIYMVQFFLCTICWTIKWWGTIQPQQLYYRFFSIFTVAESISWELWLSHGSTRIDITSRILPHAGLHAWNFVQPTCDQHMLLRTQIASAVWKEIKTQSIYFGLMILGKFDLGFITIYIKNTRALKWSLKFQKWQPRIALQIVAAQLSWRLLLSFFFTGCSGVLAGDAGGSVVLPFGVFVLFDNPFLGFFEFRSFLDPRALPFCGRALPEGFLPERGLPTFSLLSFCSCLQIANCVYMGK